jgi:hypothetical protein
MAGQTKLTTAQLNALTSTTLGDLKPYQLNQVIDVLNRLKWDRGSTSNFTAQPTITNIVTALGSNQP